MNAIIHGGPNPPTVGRWLFGDYAVQIVMRHGGIASLDLVQRYDMSVELPDSLGITALLAHCLSEVPRSDGPSAREALGRMGAESRLRATYSSICWSVDVIEEFSAAALTTMIRYLTRLDVPSRVLEIGIQGWADIQLRQASVTGRVIARLLRAAVFHPSERAAYPVEGAVWDARRFRPSDVEARFASASPGLQAVAVGTDVLGRDFGLDQTASRNAVALPRKARMLQAASADLRQLRRGPAKTGQCLFAAALGTPVPGSPEWPALLLATEALGVALHETFRERLGVSYAFSAALQGFADHGLLTMAGVIEGAQAGTCQDVLSELVSEVASEEGTSRRLARAACGLSEGLSLKIETPRDRANLEAGDLMAGVPAGYSYDLLKMVPNIAAQEKLHNALRDVLRPDALAFAALRSSGHSAT